MFSVHLQLSACQPTHFTCRDGKCVSMEKRCDNVEVRMIMSTQIQIVFLLSTFPFASVFIPQFYPFKDCDDSSDEKNCRMVSYDKEKYLKNKPPSPPHGMDKLPIAVR